MKRTAKLIMIGSILFLTAGCASQKNQQTSSNQENPSFGAKQKPSNEERAQPSYYDLLVDMDENNDGKLSYQEVDGPLKENFASIDSNGDGFLTQAEIENAPKPQRNGPPPGGQGGQGGGPPR